MKRKIDYKEKDETEYELSIINEEIQRIQHRNCLCDTDYYYLEDLKRRRNTLLNS